MSRTDLSTYIVERLKDSTNVLTLLGAMTSQNLRIYSFYPQHQPLLSSQEPAEGWMVVSIDQPTRIAADEILESVGVAFQIFTTRPTLADEVIDTMDTLWNWRIWQQRNITIGDYLLLFSKREETHADYTTRGETTAVGRDIHLYRRSLLYRWTLVKTQAEEA